MNPDKINAQMEEYVRTNEMAGATLMIRKADRVLYQNKWGWQHIDQRIPVEYSTVFRMASLTKPVTVVGAMMLAERGLIDLDDEVTKYLPAFANLRVVADGGLPPEYSDPDELPELLRTFDPDTVKTTAAARMITVRDLLSHSSGMEQGPVGLLTGIKMTDWQNDTLETRVEKWARVPLDFQPGTRTGYSPKAGLDTMARIIEVVSGKRLTHFMQEELFEPLSMKATSYHPDPALKERLAPLYKTVAGKHLDVSGTAEDVDMIAQIGPQYNSGSGGLYSTAEDFDRLVRMLANGGELEGRRLLRPETVTLLGQEAAKAHLEFQPGLVWGLGMIIRQEPDRAGSFATSGTYGWSGAFGTHFFISPADQLSVVLMMNRANIGGAGSYIAAKLEELVFERKD